MLSYLQPVWLGNSNLNSGEISKEMSDKSNFNTEIVCYCMSISEGTIRQTIVDHDLETVDEVTEKCDAGGGCGGCHWQIEELIEEIQNSKK